MTWDSIEPRTRKYAKRYGFLSFVRNFSNKYWKQVLNTGAYALKTAPKKVVHKEAEATGDFVEKKLLTELWNKNLQLMKIQETLKK